MNADFRIFNTLTRKKEKFKPINPSFAGIYVCGPTVYGDPHLGHARPAIVFDILYRYLLHLGYKVRYIRNITDVGHLEHDSDDGEDKIAKKAKSEQIEPMEVAQYYSNRYRKYMHKLNLLLPSIEPRASGHIIEQIELIKRIFDAGYAYEVNGSVYFDVKKYNEKYQYGILSGRKIDDLFSNTRELSGQQEKRFFADFALWKKANPEHIMKWNSPWGLGFPGWHLECSAMGTKYLGEQFDIHGGGMDLIFPHHESEIAQCVVANGKNHAKYWMHNNMITINGQKMAKSLNNFITLDELFTGNHKLLEKAYSPMTIKFFILQAHYRSTLDFSNHALLSAEKGMRKIIDAFKNTESLPVQETDEINTMTLLNNAKNAINDDLNTPIVIAQLFEAARIINSAKAGNTKISKKNLNELKILYNDYFISILGLNDTENKSENNLEKELIELLLEIRQQAKNEKQYTISDAIRDKLNKMDIEVKDTADGPVWRVK